MRVTRCSFVRIKFHHLHLVRARRPSIGLPLAVDPRDLFPNMKTLRWCSPSLVKIVPKQKRPIYIGQEISKEITLMFIFSFTPCPPSHLGRTTFRSPPSTALAGGTRWMRSWNKSGASFPGLGLFIGPLCLFECYGFCSCS